MQKTKFRKFIIVSVAFHLVVISAILLYFFYNPLPNGKSGTVMVGVISGNTQNTGKTSSSDTDTKKKSDTNKVSKTKIKVDQETTKKTVKKNIRTDSTIVKRSSEKQESNHKPSSQSNNLNQDMKGLETSSITNEGTPGQGLDIGSETASANTQLAYPNYNINPKPKYPRAARKRGYEGEVKLKVFVLESGKVGKIEIIRPSGYKILDNSALEAVKNWVFIPGKQNGKEVSSWVTVPINFQLKSG